MRSNVTVCIISSFLVFFCYVLVSVYLLTVFSVEKVESAGK